MDSHRHAHLAATYSAAADHFDVLPFWHYFGRRTIERLSLAPGSRVLDLCCGTGASVLPAAQRVGPAGSVLGVDLSEALLHQARDKAAARQLTQARFVAAAIETLRFPPASFDAIVSVFGLFFVDDMPGLLHRAWSWLAPGGVLAITTWGTQVLAPGEELFWEAVRAEDPTVQATGHASRLDTPAKIVAVFDAAGLPAPDMESERWEMPLAAPEDFWPVVQGTSNRAALERLAEPARARVRARVIGALRARAVRSTSMDVFYAVARRG